MSGRISAEYALLREEEKVSRSEEPAELEFESYGGRSKGTPHGRNLAHWICHAVSVVTLIGVGVYVWIMSRRAEESCALKHNVWCK
jgi:hypothetical protein